MDIADCRLPIADFYTDFERWQLRISVADLVQTLTTIGNWKSAIGNLLFCVICG
jgi:hypothetical protein